MESVKRWYVFLTSAVGLHAVAWAVITLLRRLAAPGIGGPGGNAQVLALQISIIVIGLPVYLIHWRWAQKLATEAREDRESIIRSLYLHATLAGSLGPIVANLYTLVTRGALRGENTYVLSSLLAIGVMAVVFVYHFRVLADDKTALGREGAPVIRRLYQLGFSAAGLIMMFVAADNLLRLLMLLLGGSNWIGRGLGLSIAGISAFNEVVRLLIGLGLWLAFWRALQSHFAASPEEQSAVERKLYLYLVILLTTVGAIGNATALFAGFLRRLLDLPPEGALENVLPPLIVSGVVWAYHAYVLRKYDRAVSPQEDQRVRRIYIYLVAAIGLAAFVGGLATDLTVLINSLVRSGGLNNNALKEQLAWGTAAIVAGLPTWLLPWRTALADTADAATAGEGRRSLARRIYLYFYLFAGVMTILGTLITIVFQLLLLLFGERTAALLVRDLALAVSYALIAGGLLYYHGGLVRADDRERKRQMAERLGALKVVVLDGGDGSLAAALAAALKAEFPGLDPQTPANPAEAAGLIQNAGLVIAPWSAVADANRQPAEAVMESPARKLLLPLPGERLDWVGLEPRNQGAWVRHTVNAVKQVLSGEEVAHKRPLGCAAYFLIAIGLLIAFNILVSLIQALSYGIF